VSRPPDFDELIESADPDERARLQRVHDLLVEAGPPPELSPALASVAPPAEPAVPAEEPDTSWLPRRRLGAALLLAGAVLLGTFGAGYLAGGSGSDSEESRGGLRITRTVALSGASGTTGVLNVGNRDPAGNWPMILTVRGLRPLGNGDYYTLALSRNGKPVVTCGTFNVADRGQRTLRMSAAYDLKGFDGWVVTHYDAKTHDERPVLSSASV
jgi:hypothetical protein